LRDARMANQSHTTTTSRRSARRHVDILDEAPAVPASSRRVPQRQRAARSASNNSADLVSGGRRALVHAARRRDRRDAGPRAFLSALGATVMVFAEGTGASTGDWASRSAAPPGQGDWSRFGARREVADHSPGAGCSRTTTTWGPSWRPRARSTVSAGHGTGGGAPPGHRALHVRRGRCRGRTASRSRIIHVHCKDVRPAVLVECAPPGPELPRRGGRGRVHSARRRVRRHMRFSRSSATALGWLVVEAGKPEEGSLPTRGGLRSPESLVRQSPDVASAVGVHRPDHGLRGPGRAGIDGAPAGRRSVPVAELRGLRCARHARARRSGWWAACARG
jgi:hypothetical protein